MSKTNLGKVVGDSAFEEWQKRNPGKTWEEFMKAIQGPGVLGFRYKEKTETGSLIYDVILQGDIVSGTIEIPPGAAGADFLTLEFVRYDDEGNTIVRSKNSKGQYGDEITIKRGKRGFTGGIVGLPDDAEPQPPMTDIYGTIIEHHGSQVPEGWALCNGAYLSGNKYPHLLGMFDDASEPLDVRYKFIDYGHVKSNSTGGNGAYWSRTDIVCGGVGFNSYYYRYNGGSYNPQSLNSGTFFSTSTCIYSPSGNSEKATIPDKTSKEVLGYISDLEIKSSRYMYIRALAFDGENFEYGGLLPDSKGSTGGYNRNQHPDIYFNIEYVDEDSGDWRLGVQLHNKTDFVKSDILDNMYIAEIKTTFKTKKIRLSIDLNKSTPHYPMTNNEGIEGYGMYFLGRFHTYIDDVPNRENMTVIKLPNLKDSTGRYKLVYIGQPLEITEPTMYSYYKDNIFNGEVPLSLAVNNELPSYTEGITMTEPQPSRMGYTNKYNNDTDTWELVKTHLDKEGYYYDEKGDLKYIYKPHNWFKWDFETHTWIEDTLLKEEAKNELLNKYIELELKKDKMLELKFSAENIEIEIEQLKKELEIFNG
ncbi:MAG: phage tail protein [Cetobacterium sp.]|uniref:phage tail protein n=1 Tax=Cetobacterium sp. TaxID=2071632 RepID=UPI003F2BC98A